MFPARYFVYLVGMDSAISVAGLGINWVIVLAFTCVILLVACCIFVFLLREGIHKQRLYDKFQGSVNEFIVVLSRRLEFLYGLPMYTSDPLFARLSSGNIFQSSSSSPSSVLSELSSLKTCACLRAAASGEPYWHLL